MWVSCCVIVSRLFGALLLPGGYLQDQTLLALSALAGQQSGASGGLKDLTDAVVGLGRAFEVFVGTDLLANFLTLL